MRVAMMIAGADCGSVGIAFEIEAAAAAAAAASAIGAIEIAAVG